MPRFDAVASLRMWAGEVTIGGVVLRIEPRPAADWLPVLMSGSLRAVMALAEDGFSLSEAAGRGASLQEIEEQLTVLIEGATGRSVITAFSLAAFARERWDVIGPDLVRLGIRWESDPIGRALDAIYLTIQRCMPEKELKAFIEALDRAEAPKTGPVVGVRPPPNARPLPASAEQYVRVRPKTVQRRPQDRQATPSVSPTGLLPIPEGSGHAATGPELSLSPGVVPPGVG